MVVNSTAVAEGGNGGALTVVEEVGGRSSARPTRFEGRTRPSEIAENDMNLRHKNKIK